MKSVIVITLLLLSGCASQTQLAKIESHEWTELTCSGFQTWQNCRSEAQAICQNGFYTANSLENILIQRRVVEVACRGYGFLKISRAQARAGSIPAP
ncbi:MAG: hypothetical protein ACT4OH_07485, partial [Methylophilaceae bacterium]